MDPLLLEALRFGLAILAGGLVAVIAQRLAFGDAQRLASAERQARERQQIMALRSEIETNIALATPQQPQVHVKYPTSAWSGAQQLNLNELVGPDASARINDAYAIAARANATREAQLVAYPVHHTLNPTLLKEWASKVLEAFNAARDALAAHDTGH